MASTISLLLPTRQRPNQLSRMVNSVIDTARHPELVEIVAYVDRDDPSYDGVEFDIDHTWVRGPRSHDGLVNLSVMWNHCYASCEGDIVMHCGDDIVFRTPDWDVIVREAFDAVPDKVLFAFGQDGYQDGNNFGTHGFIHRKWVETVGYLFPPLFVSDYNDAFLNDVAKLIDRHREIPIYTEHMHFCCGKAAIDQNTQERLARHTADRPDLLYGGSMVQELITEAAAKLLHAMGE